jgi:DeoR/GlpR family transcriptional regulator of sugar metabolism
MAEVAREVIVMVESDKIGRRIPNLELPWHNIHTLITDEALPAESRESFRPRASR